MSVNACCSSCLSPENKTTHIGLTAIALALLIIGSLAVAGVMNPSMGASSASYLCYGAYGGSILFGILEIINLYRAFRPKTQDSDRAEGVKNDAILQDAAPEFDTCKASVK